MAMGPAEPQSAQVANGDGESEIVRRSAKGLAACLACDICRGLLVEPLTSPQCMHCFCAACITGFIVPGRVRLTDADVGDGDAAQTVAARFCCSRRCALNLLIVRASRVDRQASDSIL